jgi:predicted site-specific integrase-resolvase
MELIKILEEIDPNLKKDNPHYKKLIKTVKFLEGKKNIVSYNFKSRRMGSKGIERETEINNISRSNTILLRKIKM